MAWPNQNSGNVFPSTASNVDRAGATAWSTPTNAISDNATDTTNALTAQSDYLVTSNYNFGAIPDGSTIMGFTVRVEASESGAGASDYRAQLHSSATTPNLVGSSKGPTAVSGTAKVISSNGSSTDMWGTTLVTSDVKSTGFGVSIWSTDTGNVLSIDYVTIAVEYFPPQTTVHMVTPVPPPINRQP